MLVWRQDLVAIYSSSSVTSLLKVFKMAVVVYTGLTSSCLTEEFYRGATRQRLRSVWSSPSIVRYTQLHHQVALLYLSSTITPVQAISARRHLPSVIWLHRSFSVAGLSSWNSRPSELKQTSLTVGQLSSRLKTDGDVLTQLSAQSS